MKSTEAFFAGVSFLVAAAAGGLLALDLVVWAFVTAWMGSALTAAAYGVAVRSSRSEQRAKTG